MTNPPSPPTPYGGIPAKHSGTNNHPINRVVIHSAVMDCEPGAARNLAKWNRDGTTGGSWHYAVDCDEVIQASYDSYVCHHAPPNLHSLGIEMADKPHPHNIARWWTPRHRRMLRKTARLTAELCIAYDIPMALLTPAGLKAGREGIVTHNTVSDAFNQSTHWDPGAWPARRFMRLVRRHAAHLQENNR